MIGFAHVMVAGALAFLGLFGVRGWFRSNRRRYDIDVLADPDADLGDGWVGARHMLGPYAADLPEETTRPAGPADATPPAGPAEPPADGA